MNFMDMSMIKRETDSGKTGDEPQFDPGVLTEGARTYLYTGFCGRGDKTRHGAMATVLGPI